MIIKKKEKGIEEQELKEVFFIVKGQYRPDKDEDGVSVSGYDPSNKDTVEWYRVIDNVKYNTIFCGSDYTKALVAIERVIKKCKTLDRYIRNTREVPKSSPKSVELDAKAIRYYGHYFREDIAKAEQRAYGELMTSHLKSTKRLVKPLPKKETPETPTKLVKKKEVQVEEKTPLRRKGLVLNKK